MKKTIIVSFIIIITIALSYGLISYVEMPSFLFAWILNLLLMMCVFNFTEALKSPFSSYYYEQKKWEEKGKIYELLGIHFFRKLLVLIGWEKLNKKANPVDKNTKALLHLHYRTKQSELGHLIIFFVVLGFTVYVASTFGILKAIWLIILNIVLNLYPILLQRYNRPRLERAINLSKHKEARITGV